MSSLHAYDDIHFFRPIFFFGEPHLERTGLGNITAYGSHGTHTVSRSHRFTCQPNPIPEGTVSLTELAVLWSQNVACGFFVSGYIPIRSFQVTHQKCCITAHQICSAAHTQTAIVHDPPLTTADYIRTGIGDIAFAAGWTINYEETQVLDFIDGTIQVGLATPTSHWKPLTYVLDIPLGYQGHTGYFIIGDASLGIFDWLTFGAHLQVIRFDTLFRQHPRQNLQFSTQSGMGATIGAFSKADHILLGLSITAGYSFTHKGTDVRINSVVQERSYIPPNQFWDDSWSMHAIHIIVDYDFATYKNPYAPRIGFICNKGFGGRHSIPFSLLGGVWDMSMVWEF